MEIPRKIGGRRSDLSGSTSDHVVIVGAGVAGSALAYALGKVIKYCKNETQNAHAIVKSGH